MAHENFEFIFSPKIFESLSKHNLSDEWEVFLKDKNLPIMRFKKKYAVRWTDKSLNSRTIFLMTDQIIEFCQNESLYTTESIRKLCQSVIESLKSKENILTIGFCSFLWIHL